MKRLHEGQGGSVGVPLGTFPRLGFPTLGKITQKLEPFSGSTGDASGFERRIGYSVDSGGIESEPPVDRRGRSIGEWLFGEAGMNRGGIGDDDGLGNVPRGLAFL